MSNELWFALDLNPEPWAVGPLGVSRTSGTLHPYMGRNQQLDAYKEAVRDELISRYPGMVQIQEPPYELEFWFWRNQADYEGANKRVRKHQVDATNMQKATEDALQGLLIENDRDVRRIRSTIVAQGPDVRGAVVIRVLGGLPNIQETPELPPGIIWQLKGFTHDQLIDRNVWPPQ